MIWFVFNKGNALFLGYFTWRYLRLKTEYLRYFDHISKSLSVVVSASQTIMIFKKNY